MKKVVLHLLTWYHHFLSPLWNSWCIAMFGFAFGCRYKLSCSQYAHQQISRYGLSKGIPKAITRILSCWGFGPMIE